MKINKILAVFIGLMLIASGYSISFILPRQQEINVIVPPKEKERVIYIYIRLNQTYLSPSFLVANIIKNELSELEKPYHKSEIDSLFKWYNGICFVDSNKCGVYKMGSEIDDKASVWKDFYITPDTVYLIDNYRPILL